MIRVLIFDILELSQNTRSGASMPLVGNMVALRSHHPQRTQLPISTAQILPL